MPAAQCRQRKRVFLKALCEPCGWERLTYARCLMFIIEPTSQTFRQKSL